MMDVFNFCWITLLSESKKFCVFFDKNTCNVKNDFDENFDKPVNRIAYLYKFGSYNISFFFDCFKDYITKVPESLEILNNIRSKKNLNVCSMSTGPGTDVVGFLYTFHLLGKPLTNPLCIKILSKQGAWRSLVSGMINSNIANVPSSSSCKLVQCDFLKSLCSKSENYLKVADVLLMCNSFSSARANKKVMCSVLKKVLQLLKPGALVFFITSKEKSTYLKELNTFGSFLYGPTEVKVENLPYNEKVVSLIEVTPLCSGAAWFAVWQKFELPENEEHLSNETKCNVSCAQQALTNLSKKHINLTLLNNSELKKESSNNTIYSLNCYSESESQFASSSLQSPSCSYMSSPVLGINKPLISNSASGLLEEEINNFTKGIPSGTFVTPIPLSYNSKCKPKLNKDKSSVRKTCEAFHDTVYMKHQSGEKDMNSLLKSFEGAISALEQFMSSQTESLSGHYQCCRYVCCSNSHLCHCTNKCTWGNSCHPHFKSNSQAGCCRTLTSSNKDNPCHHKCVAHGSNFQCTVTQDGPCIVIPLQYLTNDSLARITAAASENSL